MITFSTGAMVRFGWETFKKRPWFFIGVTALIFLLSGIASQLGAYGEQAKGVVLVIALAGVFLSIVAQTLVKMGAISFGIKAHDTPESAAVKDLWSPEMFWPYLGASILVGLCVVLGLLLLVIPGIMLALRWMFVQYLVIDKKLGVIAAMKESARITKGHRWQLLVFLLAIAGLNILGVLALVVGLLVSVPVTTFALVHAYRTLEHAASEVTPVV